MRRKIRPLVYGVLIALLPAALAAQDRGRISGQVLDQAAQTGIGGAQVVIDGTNRSVLTNREGRYLLTNVRPGEVTIRVSTIGYRSATETIDLAPGETETVDFLLEPTVVDIDALVVTVTGEQRERELANAVGIINADDVTEVAPVQNLGEALQGRSAGVTVLQSSGTTGTGSSIKIRGNSSISLSNTPVIYVDGARIDNDNQEGPAVGGQQASRLNDINPEDIEKIEIIKGPSAATLYGTEASAGVIRITTKRGRSGPPQWTFRSELGSNLAQDTDQFPDNIWHPASFGLPGDTLYRMNLLQSQDPFRNGAIKTFAGSVRGGSETLTYYLSGEVQDEEGTLPNNDFRRYYARGNFGIVPGENWDINITTGYTSNQLNLPDNDNNAFGYLGAAMLGFPWDMRITADDPATGESGIVTCPYELEYAKALGASIADVQPFGICSQSDPGFYANRSFEEVETLENQQNIERFTGSATASFRPTDWWTHRATLGYDVNSQRTGALVPVAPDLPFGDLSRGYRNIFNQVNRNLTLDYSTTATFGLTDDLTSATSFGVQYYRDVTEQAGSEGRIFPRGATTVSSAVNTLGFETFSEEKTLGVYVQEQLGWRDRLFITPAVRVDDNSAFGQDFDLAVYPKIGVSYLITDEPWFGWRPLDVLKLRGSWGRTGQQPGAFDALGTFTPFKFAFQATDLAAAVPENLGNPDLEPEIGQELELGLDMGLIERLDLELTYYDQKTKDAIVLKDLAPSSGFPEELFVNVGEVSNRGVELGLDAMAFESPDFSWSFRFNVSRNANEVTRLEEPIIFGLGGNTQRHQQGHAFASYFAPEIVVQTDDEGNRFAYFAEADTTVNPETGAVSVEGVPSYQGQPSPEWEGGISTTLGFLRHFTLYAFADFKTGHQLFNSTEEFRCGFLGGGENLGLCAAMFEKDADGEYTDEALIKQFASSQLSAAPWIEDADFMRLRTVSLRFDLPEHWASAMRTAGASVTLAGQNLKTWTTYSGLDPEINFAGQVDATRAEFLTMPLGRRFVTTFTVRF